MNIIIGHTNMDLDCFGSMVLAKYLFPDYTLVKSNLIHPVARNLYNLYQYKFQMISSKELSEKTIENIVIVDTRSYDRVKEYLSRINSVSGTIEIFDHHPADSFSIQGAILHEARVGANTTLIGKILMEKGIAIDPEDATIALTGIFADTGNFTHDNVCGDDFKVASYLMKFNPSLSLIKTLLKTLKEEYQVTLFHEILNHLVYKNIHGHFMIFTYLELEKQVSGLAAVVEKVFDVENPDVFFGIFYFEKEQSTLLIARSSAYSIDVRSIIRNFGGDGHTHAASATIRKKEGKKVYGELEDYLSKAAIPALSVSDIMTENVDVLYSDWTMKDASIFLEKVNHTGAPVLDKNEALVGFLTLRDIMKARKADQMKSPVSAYMIRNTITATPDKTIREIETLFYNYNIGHLPIIRQNSQKKEVVGIVTRSDYLEVIKKEKNQIQIIEQNILSLENLK